MTAATDRLEMEELARQVLLVLFDGINTQITANATDQQTRDAAFWAHLGRTDPQFAVEAIPSENFYPGNRPSLIEAPIEKYPNCAVYAFSATPTGSSDDTAEWYDIRIAVELMCKSQTSEEEVDARIHRTVEAAHSCLMQSRGLGGYANSLLNNTPSITIGDLFVRRQEKSRGDRWFWQGGRLEYRIDRYAQY